MQRRGIFRYLALFTVTLALIACEGEMADPPPESTPVDPGVAGAMPAGTDLDMAREGQRLFAVCAVCHGSDAAGTQLGPALTDTTWIHGSGTVEEIAAIIRSGIDDPEEYPIPMPVMGAGDFNEEQIRALSAYVYALSQAPASPRPASPN